MKDRITRIICGFGLEHSEARIYFVLLKHKLMSLTEISSKSGIKRTTCYEHVNELLRKNIIYRVAHGKKFHYAPTDPRNLLKKTKESLAKLEKEFVELENFYKETTNLPKVSFFEGKDGIRKIYLDSFETIGDAYSIFPADEYFKHFTFKEYTDNEEVIKETKLKSKDLIISDKYYKKVSNYLKSLNNDSKYFKKITSDFETTVDVLIYGNKTALVSLNKMSAIVIDDDEIAKLFVSFHKYLWNSK
jgi:sugar-specific transcriptional regulator TrmB